MSVGNPVMAEEGVVPLPPLLEEGAEDTASAGSIPPPVPDRRSKHGPLSWNGCFDEEKDIIVEGSGNSFHVYLAGTQGPVIFCLHGGGYSGLSFALTARLLKEKVRIVAMDMRGHGFTHTVDDLDLSSEALCTDVIDAIKTMYKDDTPAIVLIGHSMGGAIATRVAAKRVLPTLAGLIVVDVVEGTAIASLVHMQRILANRPPAFPNLEKAIEWSVKAGSLRNIDSARISVPSTLRYNEEKKCYTWLTPLQQSEQYWRGWYEGLSEVFLFSPVPKVLLLAGTDRLDKVLTIGQMQGKFQMIVVRNTGHAIQEDVPEEFANLVLGFVHRNRIGPYGVEIPGLRRPNT